MSDGEDSQSTSPQEPIRVELNSDYGEPTLLREHLPTPPPPAPDSPSTPLAPPYSTDPFYEPAPVFTYIPPPPPRTPNIVDAALFLVLLILGLVLTVAGLGLATYFHWLGLKDIQSAANDTRVALGTQLLIYIVGLGGAIPLFRAAWHKGFFSGIHWRAAAAWRLRYRLIATAIFCNLLAVLGNAILPFPQHAPIDKMFSTQRDAWMLACFGVFLAPFFEEMIFRGFLIPAMATAWDWTAERITHAAPRALDAEGQPQWSLNAQIFSALLVSAPFALMHSAQVGSAWGPVSLLYCVSLVLCAVRLISRSLAASTLVHATYNFMLFTVMFVESGGFRHFDKL